ncbi:sigma-E processing peptidase SpoIIGA [Kroppenstedtia pulmonis]|uniref:Sporulation sigma-E factor-processing peptidase n=1 Tax=Kroppenstedtia pulmonis TaxID=1380685 RepID=A0A7D3XR27_9BACL|nr:sigma-E processing peptidase SpoIIGA [Kroppenstedtia pulmonis]QKG84762.1 sigma-E processing peptidase SpoIIGA [Kroppenstedtia pulmonis]
MVVYADAVFLLNLCIDFLLLWLTTVIRRQRTSFWRILSAAFLGACFALAHLFQSLLPLTTLLGKLIFSLVMVWVAMGFKGPVSFLRNLGVFYLISFITGGGMFALHYFLSGNPELTGGVIATDSSGWGISVSWIFILLAFPMVWLYARAGLQTLEERQGVNRYLTKVRIQLEESRLECTGLIDTGNQLRDPITRTPVMMVELREMEEVLPREIVTMVKTQNWLNKSADLGGWALRIRLVPFRGAASKGGILLAIKPDRVDVWQKNKWYQTEQVLIGLDQGQLSSDGTYHAILHPACLPVAG